MSVIEEDLKNIDDLLRRLKIEYHIFFNGNRKKPPEDMRLRLEKEIQKLSERSGMTPTQRFRYNTMITRFYVYRDLWRRTLRDKEMGKESKKDTAAQFSSQAFSTETVAPAEGMRISLSDPRKEEDKVKHLYDTLTRLNKADSKEFSMPYPQFAEYIAAQTRKIREKHSCEKVAYIIAMDEGAIRFTAIAEKS
jgi:hypothetical protein